MELARVAAMPEMPPKEPRAQSRLKRISFGLLSVGFGVLLAFAIIEITLRFMPVSSVCQYMFEDQGPGDIWRMAPNQECTWSKGATFEAHNRFRTNNDGWVSEVDYRKPAGPLVAVIGDSYVEAVMVPSDERMQTRLHRDGADIGLTVWGFGNSGAPLSHYLITARYAKQIYGASKFIFVIIQNDFHHSWRRYAVGPGFFLFEDNGAATKTGNPPLVLYPSKTQHATWLHALLSPLGIRNLATVRYVRSNLPELELAIQQRSLEPLKDRFLAGWGERKPEFAGNAPVNVSPEVDAYGRRSIRTFFETLPEMLNIEPTDALFVLNGFPYEIATGNETWAVEGHAGRMLALFAAEAEARGYEVVDLQPVLTADFKRSGKPAVFMRENGTLIDGHWNGRGHKVAADAVRNTNFWRRQKAR